MDDDAVLHPQTHAMLTGSVLEPFVADYCTRLRQGRYTRRTRHSYLCCVAHFARWLGIEGLGLDTVGDETCGRFVAEHLPRCCCPPPVRRMPHEVRAALAHLRCVLKAKGAVKMNPESAGHIPTELVRFDRYMDEVRGLTASTRLSRVRVLARFLQDRFGGGPIELAAVTGADIRRFVLGGAQARAAATMNAMAGALRCYLGFRALLGDRVEVLAAAIPRAAHWRLAALPEILSQERIEQFLGSFAGIPSGKRAYAMARCLTDLGLRTSEVAYLRLDDIDWQAGTLRIGKGKARRADILPLPPETGRAIADYLRSERPQSANRAVFVRHVAPYDEPIKPDVVRNTVREAYRRCGWTMSRAHILRHSVASRMLREGAPLKEIADVLRHRSLDTTAIYAKVDTGSLGAVALPWPGRTP